MAKPACKSASKPLRARVLWWRSSGRKEVASAAIEPDGTHDALSLGAQGVARDRAHRLGDRREGGECTSRARLVAGAARRARRIVAGGCPQGREERHDAYDREPDEDRVGAGKERRLFRRR